MKNLTEEIKVRSIKNTAIALMLVICMLFCTVSCTQIFDSVIGGSTNNSTNDSTGAGDGINTTPGTDSNGTNDSTDSGNNGGTDDGGSGGSADYVYGSEYPSISVAEALKIAEGCTSESDEIYYFVVTIDEIENLKNGELTVSDDTGSIYVYRSRSIDGAGLNTTDIEVGDLAIISGTLKNYKGLLEIMTATVIDFITPGVDEAVPPSTGGDSGDSGDGDGGSSGGTVIFPDEDDIITSDPYENVSRADFYSNYKPAVSYMDAYYRTLHGFMSGTIADQDQEPTISKNRPMENGKYVRNSAYIYSSDGNTYYAVDSYGEVVMEIYRGGAYIMLEEVAAYVFAFGEPPANHDADKYAEPTESVWGEYLRVNNTKFSGNTSKYPYEPVLPNISGCGGSLQYYEMDVGTTGTDCDPKYKAVIYNDGTEIIRGAARIVYTRVDLDRDGEIEVNETFLFYTYNHYNDFQEYLNYVGGWGEMFGNITGGGTISSKTDYNPTAYPAVAFRAFVSTGVEVVVVEVVTFLPVKKYT